MENVFLGFVFIQSAIKDYEDDSVIVHIVGKWKAVVEYTGLEAQKQSLPVRIFWGCISEDCRTFRLQVFIAS